MSKDWSSTSFGRGSDLGSLYGDLDVVIEYAPISAIKESPRNARTHSKRQIGKIAQSIKAFGFVSPLLCDDAYELIAGHGRLAAARTLGYENLPVVRLSHLDEVKTRALRIADNKLAELSGWDREILALEFNHLLTLDFKVDLSFDVAVVGFSTDKMRHTVETARENIDPQDFQRRDRMVSVAGDVWLLGQHCLTCGPSDLSAADDIVRRWQARSKGKAILAEDGRSFDEIASARSEPIPQKPLRPPVRRRVRQPGSDAS